jgi:hypothetical protein
MATNRVVTPCSLAEVYRRFRSAYCLHHHSNAASIFALKMEAVCTSETSVNF